MPYLDSIVKEINDSIKNNLTGDKFILSLQGISKQVPRTDTDQTQIPLYITNEGEGTFNAVDDHYTVNIYHKLEGLTHEPFDLGYGDSNTYQKENAQMIMFVLSDRNKIKMTEPELIGTITAMLPSNFSKSFKVAKPGLSQAGIQISSIDNDSQAVWRREFINVDYPLKPESIFFQINYTIATVINTLCYEPCCN